MENICFSPIGYVKTGAKGDEIKNSEVISQIILKPEFAEALGGITQFSHLFVLYYLDQVIKEAFAPLKIHPKRRIDLPLIGIFATRTMLRPNPIALTIVELLEVKNNVLDVKGLDAFNGTPVLDIKPYDVLEIPKNARIPDWWKKLYEPYDNSFRP